MKSHYQLFQTRTADTRWLTPEFFVAQIKISIPNKYLGFGYKAKRKWRNKWLINSEQGTHSAKMSADELTEMPKKLSAQNV